MDASTEELQEKLKRRHRELFVATLPFMVIFMGLGMNVLGTISLGEALPLNQFLFTCWILLTIFMICTAGPGVLRAYRRIAKLQRKLYRCTVSATYE